MVFCVVFGVQRADAQSKKSLAKMSGEYPQLAAQAGVEWYYNWSGFPSADAKGSVEFVPMIWGGCRADDETIDSECLRAMIQRVLKANADCKQLRAFNEPNAPRQANFSVEQVLRVWPVFEQEIEGRNIRMGSPGVAGIDSEWLREFMGGADEKGFRVDFLCVHRRVSVRNHPVRQVIEECRALYECYKRPIWITELELVGAGLTERQVIRFYREFAERLDSDPELSRMIERYAIAYAPLDTAVEYKKVARPLDRNDRLTDFGRAFSELHAE